MKRRDFLKCTLAVIAATALPLPLVEAIARKKPVYHAHTDWSKTIPPAFKNTSLERMDVRRLVLKVQKDVSEYLKYFMFEVNDEVTRANIVNTTNAYLKEIHQRRAISDYTVMCDASNNSPERIDKNELHLNLYLAPNRSVEYIALKFALVRQGVKAEELVT